MVFRSLLLWVVAVLVSGGNAHAARVLDHYDLDSLAALAELIVKAEIGRATDVQTADGACAVWDVKVLSVLHGQAKPGSVIRVAGIEEYRKEAVAGGVEKGLQRLSAGDVVYLFLVPKDARLGYSMYRLTDADRKVVESGVRLVIDDRVHSFGQLLPDWDGPMVGPVAGFVLRTERTFPRSRAVPVEEFEKQVHASIVFAAELLGRLARNELSEAERRAILESRPEVLRRDWAHSDHIRWLIGDPAGQPATQPGE